MPDWGHRLERVTRNLKPSTYRKICAVALFLLGAIVVTGGAVRLTSSGLGCPDWPGCYGYVWMPTTEAEIEQANITFPERQFELAKAVPEVVHRYFAGSLGLLIFGLFVVTDL